MSRKGIEAFALLLIEYGADRGFRPWGLRLRLNRKAHTTDHLRIQILHDNGCICRIVVLRGLHPIDPARGSGESSCTFSAAVRLRRD